ncbi:uncharacterized protein [Palaemon carinicauda]|uniref:uncharacterized protein n=1 Tax=Palaemon carinicauda TaxID=392227 RepID=UPI0035B63DD8
MPLDIEHPEKFRNVAEPNSVTTQRQQCCEEFKIYIEALDTMKDGQKKALFLYTAGREVRKVFKTLQPTDDTNEAAIKALTTYFAPQVNKCFERYQFTAQAYQKDHESLYSFVTRLKNLAVSSVDTIGQENNAENFHNNQVRSEADFAFRINSVNKGAKKHILVEMIINGKPIEMQVDTAADVSIMYEKTAKTIPKLLLESTNRLLKGYNGFDIQVTDTQDEQENEVSVYNMLSEYQDVFEDRVGSVKNAKVIIVLKSDSTPRFFAPRPVPYALKSAVETEIKKLECEGSWGKVTYSDWATPLRIVKKNGQVRLCGDYKVTNP